MSALYAKVLNRGSAPASFIAQLIAWGRTAPGEIFAPNQVPIDAYAVIKPFLASPAGKDASGTPVYHWDDLLHRRAAMMELMRVHAGLESSWNWNEAVDTTNATSMQNANGEETGVFQVSFDATVLDSVEGKDIMGRWLAGDGVDDDSPATFIPRMKRDHAFALEFYARLVRVSIAWAGPLLRHDDKSVYPWLSRPAVAEFRAALQT